MGFLDILDLVIGIIFIYFLMSIMCSSILEAFSNFTKLRAKHLRDWVCSTFNYSREPAKISIVDWMFGRDGRKKSVEKRCLGEKIWYHFSVDGLSQAGKKVSYIPSSEFVNAIFDIITHEKNTDVITAYTISDLEKSVSESALLSPDQKRVLLQFIYESDGNLYETRKNFEVWFDKAMERLTGGYKRFSQRFLLLIGFIFTFSLNVDTITLSSYLYHNNEARKSLADAASEAVKDSTYINAVKKIKARTNNPTDSISLNSSLDNLTKSYQEIRKLDKKLNGMKIPLGWTDEVTGKILWPSSFFEAIKKLGGLLITTFALSLGATFWFDILNKLVNLRSSGKKPEVNKGEEQVAG